MPSSKSKRILLGPHTALIHGISDSDFYFRDDVREHMEPEFQCIANTIISADSICVDIGANIGIKTFVMAKSAKDGCVLAVEAGPTVLETLRLNITNNKLDNVVVVNAAVTDKMTTVRFRDNSAHGYIVADDDKSSGTEVPGITLEELFDSHLGQQAESGKVYFVKIDTEGHEYKILKNAASVFLTYNPWLFFEFNSFCLAALGDTPPQEMLKWVFSNFKYVFRVEKNALDTGKAVLLRVSSDDLVMLLHDNIAYHKVDDFLVTNRESALHEVRDLLLPNPLQKQLDMALGQLRSIQMSRSYRYTAPFRAIFGFLRRMKRLVEH